MKVLLINGSPHEKGCTYTALSEVASALNKREVETEIHYLGTAPIAGCIACGKCRTDDEGCVFRDGVNALHKRLDEFSAIVIGSPVYYAAAAGQLTSFLDRLFYSSKGKMPGKLGAAVVSCRRGGSTAALDRLNKYFTISNMPIVSSQYWNMVHGNTPEQVRQDEEGLQIMRTLGENMAWLLKCIEAGKTAGVPAPEYEPKIGTNFIR